MEKQLQSKIYELQTELYRTNRQIEEEETGFDPNYINIAILTVQTHGIKDDIRTTAARLLKQLHPRRYAYTTAESLSGEITRLGYC